MYSIASSIFNTVIYNPLISSNSSKLLIIIKSNCSCSNKIFLILSCAPCEREQTIICLFFLLISKNLFMNLKSTSFLIEERFGNFLILKFVYFSKLY